MASTAAHTWTFYRAGGLDQVKLETADDLRHLRQLDQKLWVALSCPTKGVEFDSRTLQLLDKDADGRVRAPEIIEAAEWACKLLKDPAVMFKGVDGLPLSAISDTPEGKLVVAAAKQVLSNIGQPTATTVTVAQASDLAAILKNTVLNGDGVVTIESARTEATKALITDILACLPAITDRSGKPGVDAATVTTFATEAKAYAAWSDAGLAAAFLNDQTAAAFAAYAAVKAKIEDYFARCRLAAYDKRAANALNRAETEYLNFSAKDLSVTTDEVVGLPLQRVEPERALELGRNLNPAWVGQMSAFVSVTITALYGAGKQALTDAEWQALMAKFAPYEAWTKTKAGSVIEKLGLPRIKAILAQGTAELEALIVSDKALDGEITGIENVERLARYHRDLVVLLRNFVNFADFYDRNPPPPIFAAGVLYLDQRSCELCIKVDDPGAHAGLAILGKCYIAYIACSRPGGEKMNIAACFTQGDGDYLMVGRNGIFYDRKGRDWDATITKIIDNPISIRQAFWSPYKKFVRFIEEAAAKRAQAADDASTARMQAAASGVANADPSKKPPEPKKFDVGTIAALGVGLGAIATVIGGLAAGFLGLGMWMPIGILGIMLAISGPSVIIAWLKLRQRTLGPILEGNGWAINSRVKINLPLGTSLTGAKKLPPGSKRILKDPFEDVEAKRRNRITMTIILLVILAGLAGWWWWGWNSAKNDPKNEGKDVSVFYFTEHLGKIGKPTLADKEKQLTDLAKEVADEKAKAVATPEAPK